MSQSTNKNNQFPSKKGLTIFFYDFTMTYKGASMGRRKKEEENIVDILSSKKYTKSNALINSKGKASLLAEKLFAIGIQQATEDEKTGILTTTMRGTELKKIFGTNRGSFYQDISDLVDPPSKADPSLLDWRIIIKDDASQSLMAMNVITDCSFKNGVLEIRYNNKITPQVRRLQANYTVFSLAETMPLKSIYSFKLYEILKAEYDRQEYLDKKKGTWRPNATYITEMHIVDLKLRVGVIDTSWSKELTEEIKKVEPDFDMIEKMADELSKNQGAAVQKAYNSYKRIDNFKKNVLVKAQKELEEKTSIKFRFENLSGGAGGKIYGFRFFISPNNSNEVDEVAEEPKSKVELSEDEKLEAIFAVKTMLDSSFSIKDVRTLSEVADYDVQKVKKAYDIMTSSGSEIVDQMGWLIKAIKNDYQPKKSRKAKTAFTSFQQNSYDFDDLESKLLDN